MKNELIYKYLEGNATPAEEQDVLSWISESEANKAEFCEIRALWSVRDRNSVENDPQRILKSLKALHARIDADASPHRSKRARIIRWAGWSAAAMLGVALVVKDACVAWDWSGCTVCKDECPVEGAITLDDHDRPVVHSEYCDGCGKCEQVCPSASLRAYDASVEDKGIVVVSRSSEAAQTTGAVSSEELASKRTVAVAQANAVGPHTKGVHPDGPDATREAGA